MTDENKPSFKKQDIEKFIVRAKQAGWVNAISGGRKIQSSRMDSLDIVFDESGFHYQDSFVGASDFCGQEHVCNEGSAVWSQVYYGVILKPELITAAQVIGVLRASLAALYSEDRFLGGFLFQQGEFEYRDMNFGDFRKFNGIEKVWRNGELVYELTYFGGMVRQ